MTEQIKSELMDMNKRAYDQGFKDACQTIIKSLDVMINKGALIVSTKDLKSAMNKVIEAEDIKPVLIDSKEFIS